MNELVFPCDLLDTLLETDGHSQGIYWSVSARRTHGSMVWSVPRRSTGATANRRPDMDRGSFVNW